MRNSRLALVACLVAVGAIAVWRSAYPSAERPNLLAQVQTLNQLTTVRYTIQRIVTLTEEKRPLGSESIVLIVQARVEAGVDLASMQAKDVVTEKGGSVRMRLPRAKILNVAIDEKETKVWDRQKTWWTPWVPYSLDLEKRCRILGLESAKESAMEMGILQTSQANAETSVRTIMQFAGLKTVMFGPAL